MTPVCVGSGTTAPVPGAVACIAISRGARSRTATRNLVARIFVGFSRTLTSPLDPRHDRIGREDFYASKNYVRLQSSQVIFSDCRRQERQPAFCWAIRLIEIPTNQSS